MSASIKPNHKAIQTYYRTLEEYSAGQVTHEGATETAFQQLLSETGRMHGWMLVPKLSFKRAGKTVIPDGTLRDEFNLHRGYWEAKDTADKLDVEIRKKIAPRLPALQHDLRRHRHGRPLPERRRTASHATTSRIRRTLCDLLNEFYSHTEPDIEGFEQAVDEFKERVPELALALEGQDRSRPTRDNKKFQAAFENFFDLCHAVAQSEHQRSGRRRNADPAPAHDPAVRHDLRQPRLRPPQRDRGRSRKSDRRPGLARAFSREQFLKSLDRFYVAIESAARVLGEDFTEKQHFLNTVYERFFQGYSVKVADTHGIVYTPQEIVDFMCASVERSARKRNSAKRSAPRTSTSSTPAPAPAILL